MKKYRETSSPITLFVETLFGKKKVGKVTLAHNSVIKNYEAYKEKQHLHLTPFSRC